MIQEIGGELPWNIIIEDIDDFGLELLEYRGDRTLYLIKDVGSNEIVDIGKSGD
jgi:hypothetical protein